MLVLIKSGPESMASEMAINIAREKAADIVLIRDAVYLARPDMLEGFCGTAFVLSEDVKLKGIKDLDKGVKEISYEELVDLMAEADEVAGVF